VLIPKLMQCSSNVMLMCSLQRTQDLINAVATTVLEMATDCCLSTDWSN
jgi:hypothetical protein